MQAKDMKLTISDPSILESCQPGSRRKTFWIGLAIIAVVAVAAIPGLHGGSRGEKRSLKRICKNALI